MSGVAQPAIQEGKFVGRLIRCRVLGRKPPPPLWIVWALVHIYFLIGFANRFFVLLQWGLAFLTKRREVRIFPSPPRFESRAADRRA